VIARLAIPAENLPVRQCLFGTLVGRTGYPPAPGRTIEVEASLIVTPVR
jgi:hypothetical protein